MKKIGMTSRKILLVDTSGKFSLGGHGFGTTSAKLHEEAIEHAVESTGKIINSGGLDIFGNEIISPTFMITNPYSKEMEELDVQLATLNRNKSSGPVSKYQKPSQIRTEPKIQPNSICPLCESGLKYKKCHGR